MTAFDKLKEFMSPTDVTKAMPSSPFVAIDREKAMAKLKLEERGKQNGERDFPPLDSDSLDDVEQEIVAELSEHAARAQIDATNNHRIYGQRLSELALLRELSTITGASSQALGDYRATVITRQGRLALAKDAIRDSYSELAEFKLDNRLSRPAHRGMNPIYAWSTVGVSWLIESVLNTTFLRVNDDFGLLGGFVAACVVAAINIFVSALAGRFFWPYLRHRSTIKKVTGAFFTLVWLLGIVLWNLLAGHFRDAKAAGTEAPESAAITYLLNTPFQFDSIYSYGLLVAGIVFAIVAAFAAFRTDDPYPGYGSIYRRHEERCDQYAEEIEESIDEIRDTRDQAIESASEIRSRLGAQFRERGQIIASRDSHRLSARNHQDYLEMIGNALLGHYQSVNMRSRPDGGVPVHFNRKWHLNRLDLPADVEEPTIDNEVLRAQQALEESITTIGKAFEAAIESFEHLDAIKRSMSNE